MNLEQPKIFLIEQRAEMNGTFLSILHELKFNNIHLFKNAETAWHAYLNLKPDLIICDWYPEKKDTLGFLKRVRSHTDNNYTPFIIVSGIVEHELVNQAISMGVDEYIVKPFNIKIFEDKIHAALANQPERSGVTPNKGSELAEMRSFRSKIALCFSNPVMLELTKRSLKGYNLEVFEKLTSTVISVQNDLLIDVIIVEDTMMQSNEQLHRTLLSFIAAGQIEVIIMKSETTHNVDIRDLKNEGFRHFVYPQIDIEELQNKVELFINLKKALLHTKDTFARIVNEKTKEQEFQNGLLHSIQKESSKIQDKSEQIISTSKKSSFAYQLGQDISVSAKTIESISNVFESISKGKHELESLPKERVSIADIFENAEHLFENTLKDRHLTFKIDVKTHTEVYVNPTLFTSLYMFILKAVLVDARFESTVILQAYRDDKKLFLEITATMTGYPHLKSIAERVWFESDGEMKFSLKPSINQLASSQQVLINSKFNQDSEALIITVEINSTH